MEEDVEIEMLLKSTEEILQRATLSENVVSTSGIEDSDIDNAVSEEMQSNTASSSTCINDLVDKSPTKHNTVQRSHKHTLHVAEGSVINGNSLNLGEFTQNQSDMGSQSVSKDISERNEVGDLLDIYQLKYMAEEPAKYIFVPIHSIQSDGDSSAIEVTDGEDEEGDYFMDEIADGDESQCKASTLQQPSKLVENKSKHLKNRIINKLIPAHELVMQREKILSDLETQLQKELCENKEKQKQINDLILGLCGSESNNNMRVPSFTRCFFKKFGIPYFEDMNGFAPPPNADTKKKREKGELMLTDIPKTCYWVKSHKEMLQDAIKQSLKVENSERLVKKINKLKEELDATKLENTKELNDKIKRLQVELSSIKRMSYSELLSKEDPDRQYDWMKFSVGLFNGLHSPDECKRFWHVYLKPSINKESWDINEDLKLIETAEQMQYQDWDGIAKLLGTNRSAFQCFVHLQTRIDAKTNHSSGKWSKEEDKKLLNIINASKIGAFIPWSKVSTHFTNRTHSQIYNRWNNCLNPKLVKGKFSKEEDLLIVSGIEVYGVTFQEMSSLMSNRSCAQIRERYERHLHPKTRKVGSWSLDEDEKLLSLVQKYGEQDWVKVSSELKTRTRTQARQRYGFIQLMMKKYPNWTVKKVKRKQSNKVTKALLNTQKKVEKYKDEVDSIEKVFQLSELESETFRIEKLKVLREEIIFKKFDLARKKRVFSGAKSEVNQLLLEFFKPSTNKPPVKQTKFQSGCDYEAYLNEILLLAKYFGHELQLPELEEICNNPRLSQNLKCFLEKALNSRIDGSAKDSPTCASSTTIDNTYGIDYVVPDHDDTLEMKDSYYSPPIDVTKLNFSELLKRTVFDYSYGMHKDIWESKKKRSTTVNFSFVNRPAPPVQHQEYHIPPNLLTTVGFRSLLLTRRRLKRDSVQNGYAETFSQTDEGSINIKIDFNTQQQLLDQFQETMISLFAWPKVLSVTSIDSTPISRVIPCLLKRKSHPEGGSVIIQHGSSKINKGKMKETIFAQKQDCNRQIKDYKNGISCKRKMHIEHLVMKKAKHTQQPRVPKKRVPFESGSLKNLNKTKKQVLSKVSESNQSSIEIKSNQNHGDYNPPFLLPKLTYEKRKPELGTRTRFGKRASASSENLEPTKKKTKGEMKSENIIRQSAQLENCLEIHPVSQPPV